MQTAGQLWNLFIYLAIYLVFNVLHMIASTDAFTKANHLGSTNGFKHLDLFTAIRWDISLKITALYICPPKKVFHFERTIESTITASSGHKWSYICSRIHKSA